MATTKAELLKKVKTQCKMRELEYPDEYYLDEIDDAIRAVNTRRRFTPKEGKDFEEKYTSLICKMVVYSLAKIGAEGQQAHQENGIYRTYKSDGDYPQDMLNEVIPLINT